MGVSTDAVIFYGYCWSEETTLFDADTDWIETILTRRGVVNPWSSYPPEDHSLTYEQRKQRGDEWVATHQAELDAWHEAGKAVLAEFAVETGRHCSGEYPMPYIAITNAGTTASRGYPESLPDLAVGIDWDAKLNRFLVEFGIEKPHDRPQWWLVSYWG